MEINMEVPQKLKIYLHYDSAILPLGMYPKECKSIYMRDNSLLMFIVVLFTVAHL
jgi:hypothetical protein